MKVVLVLVLVFCLFGWFFWFALFLKYGNKQLLKETDPNQIKVFTMFQNIHSKLRSQKNNKIVLILHTQGQEQIM